jgi:hypothetical protein
MVWNQETPMLSIERRGFYLAIYECKYVTDVPLAMITNTCLGPTRIANTLQKYSLKKMGVRACRVGGLILI